MASVDDDAGKDESRFPVKSISTKNSYLKQIGNNPTISSAIKNISKTLVCYLDEDGVIKDSGYPNVKMSAIGSLTHSPLSPQPYFVRLETKSDRVNQRVFDTVLAMGKQSQNLLAKFRQSPG